MPFRRAYANSSHQIQKSAGIPLWHAVEHLQKTGWRSIILRGNHCQLHTSSSPLLITVAGHPEDTVAPGALLSLIAHHALIQIAK